MTCTSGVRIAMTGLFLSCLRIKDNSKKSKIVALGETSTIRPYLLQNSPQFFFFLMISMIKHLMSTFKTQNKSAFHPPLTNIILPNYLTVEVVNLLSNQFGAFF